MLKITDLFSAHLKSGVAKFKWWHPLSTAKLSEDPCFAKWISRRSISHTPHCWGFESTCHSIHTRIQSKEIAAENCWSICCLGPVQGYPRSRSDFTRSRSLAILFPCYAFQPPNLNLRILFDSRSELSDIDWGAGIHRRPFNCFDLQQDSDLWFLSAWEPSESTLCQVYGDSQSSSHEST